VRVIQQGNPSALEKAGFDGSPLQYTEIGREAQTDLKSFGESIVNNLEQVILGRLNCGTRL
jgi:hypothetical protein